jgi:hypothetical protein
MEKMTEDMDKVIKELKSQGVSYNASEENIVGLGDVVEGVLNKFGITQERFKYWFRLSECNCTERKKYLNNLFSWHIKKKENQG